MSSANIPHNDFAKALKFLRKKRDRSQEDFGLVSSRTYVSALERDLKSPTLNKVDDLASVLEVHPLTLLTLAYISDVPKANAEDVLNEVARQLAGL